MWFLSFIVTFNASGKAQSVILKGEEAEAGVVPILSAAGNGSKPFGIAAGLFWALWVFQLPGLSPTLGSVPVGVDTLRVKKKNQKKEEPEYSLLHSGLFLE